MAAEKKAQKKVAKSKYRICFKGDALPNELSSELYEWLAHSTGKGREAWARKAVAGHSKCPPALLAELASDKDTDVRCAVAENTATPADVITQLLPEKKTLVGSTAAKNPSCPRESIDLMLKTGDLDVLGNPVLTDEETKNFLTRMTPESDKDDFFAVAFTPITSEATILKLINGNKKLADAFLYTGLPDNTNITPEVIKAVVRANPALKERVLTHSACPPELFDEIPLEDLASSFAKLPEHILAKMAGDQDEQFRSAAANNQGASPDLLRTLMRDKSEDVRRSVASNVNCPVDILDALSSDEECVWAVIDNPSISAALAEKLLNRFERDQQSFDRLARNPALYPALYGNVLATALKHGYQEAAEYAAFTFLNTPELELEKLLMLAEDKNLPCIATAVALHPNASAEIRKKAQDLATIPV